VSVATVSSEWRVDVYSQSMRQLTGAQGTYHQEVSDTGDGSGGTVTLTARLLDPPASKWIWRVKEVYIEGTGGSTFGQIRFLWSLANPGLTTRVMWNMPSGGGPGASPALGRDLLVMKDRLLELGALGGGATALDITYIDDNGNGEAYLLGVNLEFLDKKRGA